LGPIPNPQSPIPNPHYEKYFAYELYIKYFRFIIFIK
jgi:hypothetical protein